MSFVVGTVGADLGQIRDKILARLSVDLHFAVHTVFNMPFFDAPFHKNLANFMWDDEHYTHKLILAPRGSGKTSIRACKSALKFLRNPDTRSLIVSYSLDRSLEIGRYIDETLLSREENQNQLKFLFPEVMAVWHSTERTKSKTWRFPALNISGKKDAHFTFSSIDSGVTGLHVDDFYNDDLVDEVAARSQTECKRAIDWLQTTENSLEHQVLTPWDVIGTHYNLYDPYAAILNDPEFSHFSPFVHKGLIEESSPDGTTSLRSYWPSKFTVEHLIEMRRRQRGKFAAQIQQDPLQDEDSPFKEHDLRYWKWKNDRVISCYSQSGLFLFDRNLRDLTIGIVWDPALERITTRCEQAIICGAMDADENIFVLDPWALRTSIDTSLTAFVQMAIRYEPDFCGCEEVLFSELLLPVLGKLLLQASIASYNPTPLRPKGRSKDVRILATQARVSQHKVFVNPEHDKFITQMTSYPKGKYRDLLDVFAYLCEHLYTPERTTLVDAYGSPFKETIRSLGANKVTGY